MLYGNSHFAANVYTQYQCHQNNIVSGVSSDQVPSLPALRLPSALFTGRSDHLQTLKEHFCNFNKQRKYFLLHGMGGIGKTQICLQFIQQNKNWYFDSLFYLQSFNRILGFLIYSGLMLLLKLLLTSD